MYASLFSYEPLERKKMIDYTQKINYSQIKTYQTSGALPGNSEEIVRAFEAFSGD